ncbi:PREDICTED: LOW QUALITY PROTEIN: SWI/SNF-related matrix-associated actin-dependent regulator of chromatin subfamily D member 1-like [Acropora digitifera]|uniref:LOW QUALITY PROTEIN: SWI/SNF-related matrix-associated actin-dependent regulator of chromatin subfamily D member 1-like n=1 Tax=Acropora digitifera TaxID=70779 RepID=UPI00077A8D6C|nr:PREDICTED: LOW QUALITY PROTEIN: SWI/SNF-related matrix-associated actin-dependent regulator of chromatin subfamily D member 1-like [Acropora digitifera]
MATRFPASASMQKMANNPQQTSMFQRSQFQQQAYGMARPGNSSNTSMGIRMQGTSGMHPYGPSVPRAGLVPGAAAALEQARRRQDAKNRRRKKKMADKILPQRVRDLVPESQAYMDLLAFERKLDATIMRKRLDIQEALKRPMKQKKKLRIYLTTNFYVPRPETEMPQRISAWLLPPDPIVINHLISKETPENKRTTCYDIDVEVDDTLKAQMQSFLLSTASQNEITAYDNKIYETVETINQLKINREFFLGFARDPPEFINQWIQSQSQDLKVMTDVVGNPEEERRADFFHLPWSQEAVCRYFYGKVQQKRAELEQALGIRGT